MKNYKNDTPNACCSISDGTDIEHLKNSINITETMIRFWDNQIKSNTNGTKIRVKSLIENRNREQQNLAEMQEKYPELFI